MITVSKDGNGNYDSVQQAVLSIEDNRTEQATILIEPGIYEEKVFIRKNNIRLVGKDRENTVIRFDDCAKKTWPDGTEYGTFNSQTVLFAGSDVSVENITFENSAGLGRVVGQALAVFIESDRTVFYYCAFLGYQNTILPAH